MIPRNLSLAADFASALPYLARLIRFFLSLPNRRGGYAGARVVPMAVPIRLDAVPVRLAEDLPARPEWIRTTELSSRFAAVSDASAQDSPPVVAGRINRA